MSVLWNFDALSAKARRARVALIARGALAFAAATVLAAPGVRAAWPEPASGSAPVASAAADIGQALNRPQLIVAGERLNVVLLRHFYARHDFAPVWASRPAQAASLVSAVLRAGDQGLSPDLFHANLLRSSALPPLDRELLLSDAFLSYADALARGIMPIERRRNDEVLSPAAIDVAAALDNAIGESNPGAAIEALAPTTPTYRLLRQALENMESDGSAGGKTAKTRLRQIEVNLERQRWLPRRLPADRVWVNTADERLVLYHDDRPVFSTKVIVGRDESGNQSPEFEATINGIFFNPPWNVPADIAAKEILPKINRDPNYLAAHRMVMLPDGVVQQVAGPHSGLGQLMFDMKNRFDVYLHDTPGKDAFGRDDRRISHGCIRVEHPRELAALLMREPVEAINEAIAEGGTTWKNLPAPTPVFVVYETAFADADGRLQFRHDVYGRDAEIWPFLDPVRPPVAEREAPIRRKS